MQTMKTKAIRRYNIIRRVANAKWGLESRILAVTTHSLVESVINYGLAIIGPHLTTQECQEIDKATMNTSARKITGTGYTTRRETLHIMADTRTMTNHFVLKTANMLDRVLRAEGANAKTKAEEFTKRYYKQQERRGSTNEEYFWNWKKLETTEEKHDEGNTHWGRKKRNAQYADGQNHRKWEANTKNHRKQLEDLEPTSIYHVQDTEFTTNPQTKKLSYEKTVDRNSYHQALRMLKEIGWTPEIPYHSSIFPENQGGIAWDKIRWNEGAEEMATNLQAEGEEQVIQVYSRSHKDADLAIGLTDIEHDSGKGQS